MQEPVMHGSPAFAAMLASRYELFDFPLVLPAKLVPAKAGSGHPGPPGWSLGWLTESWAPAFAGATILQGRYYKEEGPPMTAPVLVDIDRRGVATVALNRPSVNNAYDDALIAALASGLARLAATPGIRLVVLRGNGKHFQAGADLAYLRRLTAAPADENLEFSRA